MNNSLLREELDELLRTGSTFDTLPMDYLKRFKKALHRQHQGKLTKKLKELFPNIEIINNSKIILPSQTINVISPSYPTLPAVHIPINTSNFNTDQTLKLEFEEIIRSGSSSLSSFPHDYSMKFRKEWSDQSSGVKLKEKLIQLFPGIRFFGEKIFLPSRSPHSLEFVSSHSPSSAPVVSFSQPTQGLSSPESYEPQLLLNQSSHLKTEASKNTIAQKESKERTVRTIAGSQTQVTLSDLEKESGEVEKVFDSELQQEQVQLGKLNPESLYWGFYSSDYVKESEWFSSQSLLLGETAYKKMILRSIDVGLLGNIRRTDNDKEADDDDGQKEEEMEGDLIPNDQHLYLNMMHPFCAVCVGVQGAGKSHTMNVLLENCFIRCPYPTPLPIITLRRPMCGLVLHYDQSESNVCEAAGLRKVYDWYDVQGVGKVVVLVSPSFYKQRKRFYGDQCHVVPLLFNWSTLGAQQLKKLMRLSENDSQLYVSVMLNFLRDFQRKELIPVFEDFMAQVEDLCNVNGQSKPLLQRLALLQSIIYESEQNVNLRQYHCDLESILECGTLVVADLTDPMLSADEANGIFQVLLEQFRKKRLDCGKVLACDEAHKYLTGAGNGREELAAAIVDVVRLMRHDGIRVLISTQSPLALPPELLELVSVTILHSFQSKDWYAYLSSKIHLPEGLFAQIRGLYPGQALVVATKTDVVAPKKDECNDDHCLALQIRPRLTTDLGRSRVHK